jgi:hypothetical protein
MTTKEQQVAEPTEAPEARKVTVSFSRKVSDGNYGGMEAGIYVEADTKPGDGAEDIANAVRLAFAEAKTEVFEQLGLAHDLSIDGRAMEVFEQVLGAQKASAADSAPPKAKPAIRPSNGSVPSTKAALWEELCSNPTKWFDNREGKRNPKSPDFKRKGAAAEGEKYPPGLYVDSFAKEAPSGLEIPEPAAFG